MPDAVIELDLYEPWDPPAPPVKIGDGRRRWPLAAVLLAAVPLLAGAAGRVDLDPTLAPDFQVMSLDEAGGRLYVTRPEVTVTGGGALLQALDPRDATPLWSRTLRQSEHIVDVTADLVLLQVEDVSSGDDYELQLLAIDAATGDERWRRGLASLVGRAGPDLLIVQDTSIRDEYPDEVIDADRSVGDPENPTVNIPVLPHHERYLALRRDGQVAWRLEIPPGTLIDVETARYPELSGLTELDPSGTLRVRDVRTGAVTATHRLDLSSTAAARPVARYQAGVGGQQILYPAGGSDAEVYDRATGRLLWHWAGGMVVYASPFSCDGVRYCLFDGNGMAVLDAATGEPLWRAERYVGRLDARPGRLVLTTESADPTKPVDIAAFDPVTGARQWELKDWFLVGRFYTGPDPDALYVWRPINNRDAVIGRLDPQTGAVAVLGRGHDFYGIPACVDATGRLACLAVGTLMVWPRR